MASNHRLRLPQNEKNSMRSRKLTKYRLLGNKIYNELSLLCNSQAGRENSLKILDFGEFDWKPKAAQILAFRVSIYIRYILYITYIL